MDRWALALGLTLAMSTCRADMPLFLHRSLQDWRSELGAHGAEARRSAAFALGRLGASAADSLPDLARLLQKDPEVQVQEMAASALSDIALTLPPEKRRQGWSQVRTAVQEMAVRHDQAAVRRSATHAIGAFGPEASASEPVLLKALRDRDESVRQNAAWALGRVAQTVESIPLLCQALDDPNSLVRHDSAAALGMLADRLGRDRTQDAVAPLIRRVRKDTVVQVRSAALASLALLTTPAHRELARELLPLLANANPEVERGAAFALAGMGGEPARQALGVLRRYLLDSDPSWQALAAASLASAGAAAQPSIEDLARCLKSSPHAEVRRNCAIAITRVSKELARTPERTGLDEVGRLALPALIGVLRVTPVRKSAPPLARAEEEVREAAIEAIAIIGYPHNRPAMPLIRTLLQTESNQNIRQRCVWALFRCLNLDEHDLTPVLLDALKDNREETLLVRYDLARVLAHHLREHAPDRVTETLLSMLNNPGLRVFHSSGATVDRLAEEGKQPTSRTVAIRGGDARYMAADALRMLGSKASQDPRVRSALETASRDEDATLRRAAELALRDITR
ncbi:MAG: HEAT repeat domain-containing protein [Gemmataceae bacterium]